MNDGQRYGFRAWTPVRTAIGLLMLVMAAAAVARPASATNFPNWDQWQNGGFRGFVTSWYLNDDSWKAFEASGANMARIFLALERPPHSNRFQIEANAYQKMDGVIAQARKRNFKIVVTFAPKPKAPDSTYWFNRDQEDSIVAVIAAFARHYSGDNVFAGFDIINEPYPVAAGHPEAPRNFNGPAAWSSLSTRIITAVRQQDPTRIIVYEWPYWAANYPDLRPIPFAGVVYSSHWYTPHDVTHQGIAGRPLGVSYPSPANSRIGLWNRDRLQRELTPVRKFQQTYNLPVYFGEFSCTRKAPGKTSFNYDSDAISIFEQWNWNWTYHAFRTAPEWDAELPQGLGSRQRSMNTDVMSYLRGVLARNR